MPTWIIVRLIWIFIPKSHPWKKLTDGKPFTYKEWRAGQTDYSREFDILIIVAILCSIASTLLMYLRML
jgi:hypothetical protein